MRSPLRHAIRRPARALVRRAALGLLALASLLAACSPCGPSGPTPPRRLADAHQVLSPLLVGENGGDLDTLDPALIPCGADYDIAQAIFPPLVTTDAKLAIVPWAAAAPPAVSADGTTYTFHLRRNMRWSDGSPIDAATYAYAINRSLDKCTGSPVWNYLANLRGATTFHKLACPQGATSQPASVNLTDGPNPSVVVVDPTTLRIALQAPAAYFLAAFTYPTSWAQPRQLIDRYGAKWTGHLADGGGFGGDLFKLTRWEPGGSFPAHIGRLTLARNDAFWGRKPALREVDYALYGNSHALWADYTAGTGDVASPPTAAADLAAARALPGYAEIPLLTVRYLHVSWAKPPFDDLRVRRAFDLALDRAALCAQVLNGACFPTFHMLIRGLPGYNADLKDPAGRSGEAALAADLADAQRLAGAYRDERCGGDYANCPPIWLVTASSTTAGQPFQSQWQAAFPGWKITFGAFRGQVASGSQFQIFTDGWGADYADPQDVTSRLVRTGADYNAGGVSVPEADALLDRADVMQDQAGRLALYQQAEQLYVDRVAWIPWSQGKGVVVVRPRVVGWAYAPSLTVPLAGWQSAYLQG